MSELYTNSIFFIDVDKIKPNPYQPRREFEPAPLKDLSDSIRQYGVLQPLVVSRIEHETADGGLVTEYELIAGERRLRASKLAGLSQVPAIIRVGDDSLMKLELAIIENLQREDLNAVERARAFQRFVEEFKYSHTQIGQKIGKSREYVSNSIRLLALPEAILTALSENKITEGHTRPLMMLKDRPEEQETLFKEILVRRINVREAERIARRIAVDKARKKSLIPDAELQEFEHKLAESLGTRVHIEPREVGGKITIDYFSPEDLDTIMRVFGEERVGQTEVQLPMERAEQSQSETGADSEMNLSETDALVTDSEDTASLDDRTPEEKSESEAAIDDLYNIKNFSL